MSFASMHNDYLDPDRHLPPEPSELDEKRRRAGLRIMREMSADNWGQVYRALYKGTACGVSVGVMFNGADAPAYCSELYKYGKDCWPVEIYVSSIVEGVDQTTDTVVVPLDKPNAMKRLYAACDEVEKEADLIWKQTHGCEKCAELAGYMNPHTCEECEGGDGFTPVHPDCPQCKGGGMVV